MLDTVAPAAVTGLAVAVQGRDFVVSWTAPTTNADGSTLDDLRDYEVSVEGSGAGTTPATEVFYTTDSNFTIGYSLNRSFFVDPRPVVSVTVRARDRVGNLSAPANAVGTNPAPTAPVLVAVAKRNAVELTWTNAFDGDGQSYNIFKNSVEYARVSASTRIWTDTDVGSGSQSYYVQAEDAFGQTTNSNTEIQSELAIDTSTDTIAPKPPTALSLSSSISGPGESLVTLSWTPPIEDADNTSYTDNEGFEIRYRSDVGRPWVYEQLPDLRADPAVDTTTVQAEIPNVPSGITLSWEVRAFDRSRNYSTWATSSAAVAADTTPPAAPTGLAVDGGIRTIVASWDSNAESDLAGYRLYAATTAAVALIPANLKFEGLGTSASFSAGEGETWYVKVVAYDTSGNVSTASLEQSATTLTLASPDTTPPSNVTGLALAYELYYHGSSQMGRIRATWTAATDDDIYGYVVSWRQEVPDGSINWTEVVVSNNAYTLTGIQLSDLLEDDADLTTGLVPVTYRFRVKAIDTSGNKSTNWSTESTITIDPNGEAPRGEIMREVPVTFQGAIQSDNFINLSRGFRLSERSLEIYGDEEHDVSILFGSGGQGLNLSTINSQLWFGSGHFDNATWRVGPSGAQRSGGPGAVAERLLSVAEYIQPERWVQPAGAGEGYDVNAQVMYGGQVWTNTSGADNITEPGVSGWTLDTSFDPTRAFYQTATPTANATGDIWSDGATLYRWDGLSWVDEGAEPVDATDEEKAVAATARAIAAALYRGLDEIFAGEGAVDVYVSSTVPVSPSEHDLWYNDSLDLFIRTFTTEDVEGTPVVTETWQDMFSVEEAFYVAEDGTIWSGASSAPGAPWSITPAGRAEFSNVSLRPGELMPAGSSLISVTSDAGDALFAIRKRPDSSWDVRLATDMFIDASGNLQLNGGDINLTSGNITLNGGIFEMSGGQLNLTGTPVTLAGSDLTVQSGNIIIDGGSALAINPTGIIRSANYDYETRQGWAIDNGNLYLFDGEINAALLDVKSEQNLVDYGYSTMSYPASWYDENVLVSEGATAGLTSLWSRYGPTSLQLQGGVASKFSLVNYVGESLDYSRVRIEPNKEYIVSAYVSNLANAAKDITMFFTVASGQEISSVFSFAALETRRIWFHALVPNDPVNTGAYVGFSFTQASSNFAIDGVQFEEKLNSDLPSTFNIGGGTVIDGGTIRTGAIASNNYIEGFSGWRISTTGEVEFQGGTFRGQLFAEDFVSGTIDNQEFLLSDIESFIEDPEFAEGWDKTVVMKNTTVTLV